MSPPAVVSPARGPLIRLLVPLAVVLALGAAVLPPRAPAAHAAGCAVAPVAGRCPVVSGTTDPGGVTLRATAAPDAPAHARQRPARRPGAPAGSSRPPRVTISLPPPIAPPPPHRPALDRVCESVELTCGAPPGPAAPRAQGKTLPTLVDVARVVGQPSAARMQPDGWAVVGRPAVFLADGAVRTRPAVLLGRSATVRFTPTSFHWDFGDGASLDTARPGDPWQPGGAAFAAGPTGHAFADAGRFLVSLVADYRAEYRYGRGSWVPLAGTLSLAADPLPVTVLRAKTVLVAHDCSENPAGPGCSPR